MKSTTLPRFQHVTRFVFVACLLLFTAQLSASSPSSDRLVRKAVNRALIAPHVPGHGLVDVEFAIDCDGYVQVLTVHGSSSQLEEHVVSRLEKMKLTLDASDNKVYHYRFVFRKEA
jgi:hypothetical protein